MNNSHNVIITIPPNNEEIQNRIFFKKINKTISFAIFFVLGINILIYNDLHTKVGTTFEFIVLAAMDFKFLCGSVYMVSTTKKRLDLFLSQNIIFSVSVFLKLLMFAIKINMIKNWYIWLLCGMNIIFWVGFTFLFLKDCSQLYLRDDED